MQTSSRVSPSSSWSKACGWIQHRHRLAAVLAALAVLVLSVPTRPEIGPGEQWFPIGPAPIQNGQTYASGSRVETSGRATVIAVNPSNPSDVWLGTATGGVWHSQNAGAPGTTWKPMTDSAPSLSIGAIALDDCTPTRCDTVWIGTGENNIRRHTYYGAGLIKGTWFGGEFTGYSFAAPFGDSQTRFGGGAINDIVINGSELLVAVSSGQTSSASQSTVTAPAPADGFGVHRSTDGGTTWTLAAPSPGGAKPTDLELTSGGDLFAGFLGRGIFKRSASGGAWCPLHPGLTVPAGCPPAASGLPDPSATSFDHVEIAIHQADPSYMYVALGRCSSVTRDACEPDIYRTTDSGATWTQATANASESIDSYTRYTHALTIHPSTPSTLIYGGLKLWRSTDSGENFSTIGTSTLHPDHQDVVFPDPGDTSKIYNANDGGFYYSLTGGSQWHSGNYDLQIVQFYSVGADIVQESGVLGTESVIGGTQDNGTNLFSGGRVWQHVLDADGGDSAIQDAMVLFGSQQLIGPHRSTSGGGLGYWSDISSGISSSEPSAFYPPFILHPVTQNVYFATDRLLSRPGTGVGSFSAISPVFDTQTTLYPDLESKNVISTVAVAPSDADRVYVGLYSGAIWVTTAGGPCDGLTGGTPTCWREVGGPNVSGDGLPNTVVTSLDIHPTIPDRVYATYSGFGVPGGNRVFTSGSGGSGAWSDLSLGLPDLPVNVIKIDPDDPSVRWLGTDRGVYRWNDDVVGWEAFGPSRGMPNVPVYDLAIDNFRGRVYAATFGRGMFLHTIQPVIYTYEGWMDGDIWDILIYGSGFKPSGAITSCTVDILQEDGTVCATGNIDAYGQTNIEIGATGNLVTDHQFRWDDKGVIAGCLNRSCVGGTPIGDCLDPSNVISSVRVACGGQVAFSKVAGDCPQQANPPSSILSGGSSPLNATEDGSVDVLVATAATAAAHGGDRVLCGARVDYQQEDTALALARRIRDAINAAPGCQLAGVTALVPEVPNLDRYGGEDFPEALPMVRVEAPGVTGGQLIVSLRKPPGQATGICFNFDGLGLPTLRQLAIMRTTFTTPIAGADGGTVTLTERSPIGTCKITIPTTPGQTGEQIAVGLRDAFLGVGNPGLPECEARQNPHELMLEEGGLVTVMATGLTVCTTDPNVGILVGPDGVDLEGFDVDGDGDEDDPADDAKPRRGFGLAIGSSIPIADDDPDFDSAFSVRIDYRLPLGPKLTLVPAVGYAGFNGERSIRDRDLWDLSVALRYAPVPDPEIRFFGEVGPALYIPGSGGGSEFGIKLGTGLVVPLVPRPDPTLELEIGVEGHVLFDNDDLPDFLRAYVGLVVRH